MYLSVEQIFYTSFANIGFQCLVSPAISLAREQAFIQNIVERYWNSYNPPEPGYRGVYIHQLSWEETFFGWLYNDGRDDLGRVHIPYFISYFLVGRLDSPLLKTLWNCLEVGPIMVVDRQNPPRNLESIIIPNSGYYQSSRLGVYITRKVQQQSQNALKQGQLINQFVAENITFDVHPSPGDYADQRLTSLSSGLQLSQRKPMNTSTVDKILQDLILKPIGIQGVSLVSKEGQLLSDPIGIDEDSTSIMSGVMLYVAQTTQDEFNWQDIEMISLRSKEGHIVLASCSPEIYLLIKAGKVLTGLLEGEISRAVKKLQAALQAPKSPLLPLGISPKLLDKTVSIDYDYDYLEKLGGESHIETNSEVRYRDKIASFQEISKPRLMEMAQDLIDSYPDFVAAVQDMDRKPEITDQNMLQLGQYVGQGLVAQGKIKQVSVNDIPAGIKKLVLPVISPFMIADAQDSELRVHANPFCLYKTSDQPSCYFLQGMIQGLLQSVKGLPQFTIDETSCKATGADSCTFTID